jgi:hypothetical protein
LKTSSLKRYSQLLLKSSIVAVTSALFLGVLHPIPAQASPTQLANIAPNSLDVPSLNDVPENIQISKSHADLGESANPYVTVTKKSLPNWDYVNWAHLYDVDTGKHINSIPFNDTNQATVELSKFADYGLHHYQVIFDGIDSEYMNNPPENILDFDRPIIGKSNILEWERKNDFTINLKSEFYPWDGYGMRQFKYDLNQEINGDDYKLHLYNTVTGDSPYYSTASTDKNGGLGFVIPEPGRKTYEYKAILAQDISLDYDSDGKYRAKYNDVLNRAVQVSNPVSLTRDPWGVTLKDRGYVGEGFPDHSIEATYSKVGGGVFKIYVVENSTKEIVWSDNGDFDADYKMDMKGHTDVDWLTAYVALDANWYSFSKPKTFDDLQDVVALLIFENSSEESILVSNAMYAAQEIRSTMPLENSSITRQILQL